MTLRETIVGRLHHEIDDIQKRIDEAKCIAKSHKSAMKSEAQEQCLEKAKDERVKQLLERMEAVEDKLEAVMNASDEELKEMNQSDEELAEITAHSPQMASPGDHHQAENQH